MAKFNDIEIEIIKESFELRKENSESKMNVHLDKILSKISISLSYLTRFEKSLIIGCIKELSVYPNLEIFKKTEFEIFLVRNEVENYCLKIDNSIRILNKLKANGEPNKKLFVEIFEKINKLLNSKLIYYSISKKGEIYKVGIVTEKNKGIKVELCSNVNLDNFNIDSLNKDSFMKSTKPTDLIKYLDNYEKTNNISENHKRIRKLLENASA